MADTFAEAKDFGDSGGYIKSRFDHTMPLLYFVMEQVQGCIDKLALATFPQLLEEGN
jgi:hypothetical protein